MLYAWANDPMTRHQSFSSEPIPWVDHLSWFHRVLADPQHTLWFLLEIVPVASIRFDAAGARARVSVQVAPDARGRGLGLRVVQEATALYVSATARSLDAHVKQGNTASARIFERAGFRQASDLADGSLHFELAGPYNAP